MHVRANAFTETGPSPFNLAVESQSDNALTGATGLELPVELR